MVKKTFYFLFFPKLNPRGNFRQILGLYFLGVVQHVFLVDFKLNLKLIFYFF